MMLRLVLRAAAPFCALVLAAPIIAGVGGPSPPSPLPILAAAAQPAEPAPPATDELAPLPRMDFGTWGVGLEAIDPAVAPGDDFFAFINGRWVAQNTIPDDRASFGSFALLAEEAARNIEKLIGELVAADPPAGTPERRIVDAYKAYLETDAIEAAGLAPAYPFLGEIFAAPDLSRLAELFAAPGYPALVRASVGLDARDPTRYLLDLGFDGMGLPDRDYYLRDSPRNLEIRARYVAYLATLMAAAGYHDPQAAAEAVYAFEHKVAELEWDRRFLRNPILTVNHISRAEALALAGDFPLDRLLAAGGFAGQDLFDIAQLPPSAEEIAALGLTPAQLADIGGGFPAMLDLLRQTPLPTLKAWMAAHFLRAHAPVLPSALDQATFAFFGTVINGQAQQQPRWKRAIGAVEGQLGEQLSALYVARHFPPAAKAKMEDLVANLRRALEASIRTNDWMTPATTEQALAKLATFEPMIGYPDTFETYDGLVITATDPLGNRIRAIAWRQGHDLARLGGPVDRREWSMLAQTVNAYYSPLFNQIVFPAAILQPPFFGLEADPAVNYGAIGAVIGHEIGHGFDDQGSRFDASGALRDWWQPEDRAAFEARAARLKSLIEQYCPVDEGQMCLKGEQAIGETIGDVVGLQIAHRAWRLSLGGQEPPVIDGLTGDQRFFLGFGQIWREMYRPEALRNRVMTANHPPATFRLNNAVRHLDAWYEAFGVQPGHALYLPPAERVRIW